jgi:hypothetical protein
VSIVADVTITFRSRRSTHKALEVPEQEIDVEAALVRLVQNDRVVAREPAIALRLRQQDPVRHELHQRLLADLLGEAHLEPDALADLGAEFLRHAPRHGARRDAARLGAADHAGRTAPGHEAQLRQLGGLARAGLARDHQHLVLADQPDDAVRPPAAIGRSSGIAIGGTDAARAARRASEAATRSAKRRPARVVQGHPRALEPPALGAQASIVPARHERGVDAGQGAHVGIVRRYRGDRNVRFPGEPGRALFYRPYPSGE